MGGEVTAQAETSLAPSGLFVLAGHGTGVTPPAGQ